jgi:endo-1,4-beta-xylanase
MLSMLNRRSFFRGLSAFMGAFLTLMTRSEHSQATGLSRSDWSSNGLQDAVALRDRAAQKGLIFGSFLAFRNYQELQQNPEIQARLTQECSLLVGGFYWSDSRPDEQTFNFSSTDQYAQFTADRGILFRGHPLIWHEANPPWLNEKFNSSETSYDEVRNLLTQHIATVVQRYAGQMHSWDVINEAIEPGDGRADSLRHTPWLKKLGADYIEIAFRTAAAADPNALLVYNENGLEYDTNYHDQRRAAVLNLLHNLKSKDVPVHALGIQSHLNERDEKGQYRQFNSDKMQKFLDEVASLDLKILITELDVTDQTLPADIPERDRLVAQTYQEFLSMTLQNPAVTAVITWGISDDQSWLANFAPRNDGLSVRPLPLNSQLNRKLAWQSIAQSLDQSIAR